MEIVRFGRSLPKRGPISAVFYEQQPNRRCLPRLALGLFQHAENKGVDTGRKNRRKKTGEDKGKRFHWLFLLCTLCG